MVHPYAQIFIFFFPYSCSYFLVAWTVSVCSIFCYIFYLSEEFLPRLVHVVPVCWCSDPSGCYAVLQQTIPAEDLRSFTFSLKELVPEYVSQAKSLRFLGNWWISLLKYRSTQVHLLFILKDVYIRNAGAFFQSMNNFSILCKNWLLK